MFRVLLLVTSLVTGNDSIWMNGPIYTDRAQCVAAAKDAESRGTDQRRAVCLRLDSAPQQEQTERVISGTSGEAP